MNNSMNPFEKQTVQTQVCNLDSDCGENKFCSFNSDTLSHECIPKDKKILYQGCLNTDKFNEYDRVESKSKDDQKSLDNCIEFTRRQKNKDGFYYNYMIFKNKKNSFVDVNTINIYLKCNKEVIMVLPSKEFFDMKCSEDQQLCTLIPNKTFEAFVKSNSDHCGGNLSLEIEYGCENENIQTTKHVPIDIKNLKAIKLELKCPIQVNDDRFQSKCIGAYFDNTDSKAGIWKNLELLDKNIPPEDCVQPVYKVPMLVSDIDVYQQLMSYQNQKKVLDYNQELKEKENELKMAKMKFLKQKYKALTKRAIDDEDALSMVEATTTEYFANSDVDEEDLPPCDLTYNTYNISISSSNLSTLEANSIEVKEEVTSIEKAKSLACELQASAFVWFSQTYNDSQYQKRLFVITPSQVSQIEAATSLDKELNTESTSITIYYGYLTSELTELERALKSTEEDKNSAIASLYSTFGQFFEDKFIHTDEKIVQNDKNLNNMDNEITKLSQQIQMNQFESEVNNELLTILGWSSLVLLILFVLYYTYKRYY